MKQISIQEILCFLEKEGFSVSYEGQKELIIKGFCSLSNPKPECITWMKAVNAEKFKTGQITINPALSHCLIVTTTKMQGAFSCAGIIAANEPKAVFFRILDYFWKEKPESGIAKSAVVRTKEIGENVTIGENCTIGEEVSIGDGTIIEHNVVICHRVKIGRECIIHSGTVIGTDGFGYYSHFGKPEKVRHYGGVLIEDNVEIGANVCIDRGTIDDTVIGADTKIDNLVHIAHNAQIGKSVMVVAGAVVCGSAKLCDGSYIAPGGIIKNQITVAEGAFAGLGAVVTKDTEPFMVMAGMPAKPLRQVKERDK